MCATRQSQHIWGRCWNYHEPFGCHFITSKEYIQFFLLSYRNTQPCLTCCHVWCNFHHVRNCLAPSFFESQQLWPVVVDRKAQRLFVDHGIAFALWHASKAWFTNRNTRNNFDTVVCPVPFILQPDGGSRNYEARKRRQPQNSVELPHLQKDQEKTNQD